MISPEAKIAASIYRALVRPEILPTLRRQILADVIHNIKVITDEEIETMLKCIEKLNNDEKDKRG